MTAPQAADRVGIDVGVDVGVDGDDVGAEVDVDVDYQQVRYPYRRHRDQDLATPARHPVVVVGAGPVGLSLAIDLALQQVPVVLLNDDGRLSVGSRALCFAKRTLEIFDRLGCGQRLVDRGVSWDVGRVFFRDEQVYQFNLSAEGGHQRPAFVNLPQYEVEGVLVERALSLPLVDLRWHHALIDVIVPTSSDAPISLRIQTPEGDYTLLTDYLVACDGARSPIRTGLGLGSQGRRFLDRFLIADVRMTAPFPAERWFWFDPPFHPGRSVLLHRQPKGVWRIDFQLGWDADPELEKQPERILPRVRALMTQASQAAGGDGTAPEIELVWASVYTFACSRMASFRHGRVLFAGDAAHGVSPFGARGANSGVQDADNLAWKLASVLRGEAGSDLLDSYAREREAAADENIRHSSRATDFITPKSEISHLFRAAVLDLARDFDFARRLVNSGRLSVPSVLAQSTLNTADVGQTADSGSGQEPAAISAAFEGPMRLGAVALDAPVMIEGRPDWLLRLTRAGRFTALVFAAEGGGDRSVSGASSGEIAACATAMRAPADEADEAEETSEAASVTTETTEAAGTMQTAHIVHAVLQAFEGLPAPTVLVVRGTSALQLPDAGAMVLTDPDGLLRTRYDARPGSVVLMRPDQHVCARWRQVEPVQLKAAVRRALALRP
ncbi:FAD-dependent oxidoreductase [Roseateles amylovorans]|uniref:FAD-dependent oxidoreductase n=1 Tax=Roseateles amylovorans TaxID=2978473 RepID=A0ABY6AXB0_9BURK|nr:FAD-dependent oxidoreductase [Roseateles amylovorans]UXH77235.1 FAD-dependent oxidoreductase [Roseateles amylovorans]